jgi:hypothetical protein
MDGFPFGFRPSRIRANVLGTREFSGRAGVAPRIGEKQSNLRAYKFFFRDLPYEPKAST